MLLDIFFVFIKIGALAFGGAYAAIPVVEREVVEVQQWMTYDEFANLLAIDEMTPGPIIVNASTFIGMNVGGIPGAIVATLGAITPACIIGFILINVYKRYNKLTWLQAVIGSLKCMAFALILSTFVKMTLTAIFGANQILIEQTNIFGIILIVISFYLINKKKISPVPVMLVCGAVNVLANFLQ